MGIKKSILATGAQLKSTFCISNGKTLYVSEDFGNLDDAENFDRFVKAVDKSQKNLKIKPRVIACDMHPEYLSTKFAKSIVRNGNIFEVQHHHAHIAACMAENDLNEKIIGIAFDGTGFGTDSNIWGSEILVADYEGFERAAHFEYVKMPGADMATKQPWRMACSYLYSAYGKDFLKLKIDFVKNLDRGKWRILEKMMENDINSPLTSSAGRLFDAVSALCMIRQVVQYEAQAAVELEKIIEEGIDEKYDYRIEGKTISFKDAIKGIVSDLRKKVPSSKISAKFHNTLACAAVDVCKKIRKDKKIKKVALSGGVFQNKYLNKRISELLTGDGFEVFKHKIFKPNDSSISLGQAFIAMRK